MLKYLSVTVVAALLALGTSFANQTAARVTIPVDRTPAWNGKVMFTSYCAPCHGADGRGHGPAAAALKTQPTDLTTFSKNNHGRFPEMHIVSVLRFGSEVPAHGSDAMPVWGPILGKMNQTNAQDKELRISNLSRYLESIQRQ
jgi:mono/diheme cytochrome c family protein